MVSNGNKKSDIVFDPHLGLAVEATSEGITLDSLWRVI